MEQQQLQIQKVKMMSFDGDSTKDIDDHTKNEEITRSALASFKQKEDEIDKKKKEVRGKVQSQLGRVEEATKRLAVIRKELESLADPMRKEVVPLKKKIDTLNKELKPLGLSCLKKEKEYKEVLQTFNDKNKEKSLLLTKLMELVSESEKQRMKKLEELSKIIDSVQ